MSAKELNKNLEDIFANHTDDTCITYEDIVELFEKAPTSAQVKNIIKHAQKYKKCLFTSSEHAKVLNEQESDARRAAQMKMIEDANNEDFDIMKERELLEWSRSDSPVRMYLREMGQIPLLTKEEEVSISKRIENGENIILDAICSVPYLIDFILDYKDPLINRERRVKELFKNFEDDGDSGDDNNSDDSSDDDTNEEKEIITKEMLSDLCTQLQIAIEKRRPQLCEPILKSIEKYNLQENQKFFDQVSSLVKKYKFYEAKRILDER